MKKRENISVTCAQVLKNTKRRTRSQVDLTYITAGAGDNSTTLKKPNHIRADINCRINKFQHFSTFPCTQFNSFKYYLKTVNGLQVLLCNTNYSFKHLILCISQMVPSISMYH